MGRSQYFRVTPLNPTTDERASPTGYNGKNGKGRKGRGGSAKLGTLCVCVCWSDVDVVLNRIESSRCQ